MTLSPVPPAYHAPRVITDLCQSSGGKRRALRPAGAGLVRTDTAERQTRAGLTLEGLVERRRKMILLQDQADLDQDSSEVNNSFWCL